MHLDKHAVKMIIEYAQLLSTAHRVLDGSECTVISASGRKKKVWKLSDGDLDSSIYAATHINHPSAKWVRHSRENYEWLYSMWSCLLDEYTHRYGKVHKTGRLAEHLGVPPTSIESKGFSPPWRAMPDDVKIGDDSLLSYRNYYITYKHKMARWTNRQMPEWFADGIYTKYGDSCHIKTDVKNQRLISQPLSHYANL